MASFAIAAFASENPVFAQDAKAAIKQRQMTMKGFDKKLLAIIAFVKRGEGSAEDIAKRAAEISAAAEMLPSMFPAKSGRDMVTDPKTTALAMIWKDRIKFESIAVELVAEAAKLEKISMTGDKAAIWAQIGILGRNTCGACHDSFRSKLD